MTGSKKNLDLTLEQKRKAIEPANRNITVYRQCELLGLNRGTLYYKSRGDTQYNETLMRLIDKQYVETPFYGIDKMTEYLCRQGHHVNHKRVRRLMRRMGLEAVYPRRKRGLSISDKQHKIYPYLLKDVAITRTDQVWSADITYIRMYRGWLYLVAVMDWFSRYVLSWSVSNTLESLFCLDALDEALTVSRPVIFHSDQGKQYSSTKFIEALKQRDIRISMSGRGRAFDNILVERLWRTVKYEEIYLREYADGHELIKSLRRYFDYYNNHRPHMALDYKTPSEMYFARGESAVSRPVCGGHTATSFLIAHSRSAAGPSDTQLSDFAKATLDRLADKTSERNMLELKKSLQLTPYSEQNLVLTTGRG